jgi:hypothetical protein
MGITQFTSIACRVWPQQNAAEPTNAGINGEALNNKMTSEMAIHHANRHCKSRLMQGENLHFSSINASKNVWWLDIPVHKITQPAFDELNLLLYDEGHIIKISSSFDSHNASTIKYSGFAHSRRPKYSTSRTIDQQK